MSKKFLISVVLPILLFEYSSILLELDTSLSIFSISSFRPKKLSLEAILSYKNGLHIAISLVFGHSILIV